MAVQLHYKDSYGTVQTFYPPVKKNEDFLVDVENDVGHTTRNWSCLTWTGFAAGTLFLVSTVVVIGCASNGCYGTVSDDEKSYCDSACSSGWIAAEVISGITSLAICCISSAKK